MDVILVDPSPLAHWIYPEEMALASMEREYREFHERNHGMFIIIGGMLVVAALVFLIFVEEGGCRDRPLPVFRCCVPVSGFKGNTMA